jgi:putative transposase
MESWLSCEEVIKVTGWSLRTVQRKAREGQLTSRDRNSRLANGKPIREYSTKALPPLQQIQAERLVDARSGKRKALKSTEEPESCQIELFSKQTPTPIPVRIPVTDEHKAEVDERIKAIAPLVELFSVPKGERFPRLMPDGKRILTWGQLITWCGKQSGHSARTIRRMYTKFTRFGQGSLPRRQRADKNKSRFFNAHPKAMWLAAYLYLSCKQSCRVIYEAIVRDAKLIEVHREDLPSYETVRAWLKSMPPCLTVYAREGERAYRERMSPFLKRKFTDVYSNQVWVGDCMIHDMECANDCFENLEWGAPIRLRLDAMLDYRSRLFVGASWCWEGSSRSIAATMRRGIIKYGPPEHWYVDNGKPYKKVAKGARPGYMRPSPQAPENWREAELNSIETTGFLARLGIATTHCLPFHPQAKSIERAFRTVHERFDKAWPTYTSGSPFTRPESTEEAMMVHRRLFRAGRVKESKYPLASQVILGCLAWMEEYADTPHDGEGMNGETPRQIFEANLNPNQKPTPDFPTLALLMAEREQRLVSECAIRLKNRRYVPLDESGFAIMHEFNEREVQVVYDPADFFNVAAVDSDGNFLAWLEAEEMVRFAPYDKSTQAKIADSMAIRRRLEKGVKETIAVVTRAARATGAVSPLEAMAGRLRLPSGETGVDIITQRVPRFVPKDNEPAKGLTPGEATDRLAERLRRRNKTAPTASENGNQEPQRLEVSA